MLVSLRTVFPPTLRYLILIGHVQFPPREFPLLFSLFRHLSFRLCPAHGRSKVPSAQAKIDKRRRKDNLHEDKPHSKKDKGKNNRLLRMTYGKRKSDVRRNVMN